MPHKTAFVLKGYPRLSETFIAQEIRALERRHLSIAIYALRHPTDEHRHPVHDEIAAPVHYLPEYLHDEPGRVFAAWRSARHLAGFRAARRLWLKDLARDRSRNRVRRFGQAMVLATMLPDDIEHIHAHFMHTPASVARYAARMRGLPWSFSAHAKDIWTSPAWEKAEKLGDCTWAVTCTRANRDHLAALAPGARVELVYHGLDLTCFTPPPEQPSERPSPDGGDAARPVMLLSVGRAVEKKGYDDLLAALARLPETLAWRLDHIGGGPLLGRLKEEAARLGIAQNIRWLGAKPQAEVLAAYRAADLFVLASRKAADGDMDGLPNVLMEAQSQALAVISTRLSAVPELIEHGETGWLVAPRDVAALADAIEKLARDSGLRAGLGGAGLRRIHERFALEPCLDPLARRFGLMREAA